MSHQTRTYPRWNAHLNIYTLDGSCRTTAALPITRVAFANVMTRVNRSPEFEYRFSALAVVVASWLNLIGDDIPLFYIIYDTDRGNAECSDRRAREGAHSSKLQQSSDREYYRPSLWQIIANIRGRAFLLERSRSHVHRAFLTDTTNLCARFQKFISAF